MAIFFALISLIGWAGGDVFATFATRKLGHLAALFWFFLIGFLMSLFYLPFAGNIPDLGFLLIAFLIGIIHYLVGNYTYFKALEKGNASIVGTISGSFLLVTILLSVTVFQEKLSLPQIIGILTITTGFILTSLNFKEVKRLKLNYLFSDRSIIYAIAAMFSWGFAGAFLRIPVEAIGWFWSDFVVFFLFIPFLFFQKFRKALFIPFKDIKLLAITLFFGLFLSIGDFAYNLGISFGYTSVVAPIAGCYSVLFVFLTRLIFKEPLSRKQSLGIILSLIGIVIISSSS